jgi:anti-sigma regulatory factor (Ser/Thr protein kinase)/anti-anti-sigma regulatory factor
MLTYELTASGPATVVRLAGQLGLATVTDARTALHKALAGQPSAIVVDLSDMVVLDDIALTVLSAFGRIAGDWPGCPVLVSATDPIVRRDLDRMAISRTIPVYRDRQVALAAAQAVQVPRRYRQTLPPTVDASTSARQLVRDACLAWDLPHLVDDVELVVTEIVSNAVRHVGGMMELMVTMRERYVHVSVRDGSPVKPVRVLPDLDSGEGGRGLILIDAVATGWGATEVADGKVVWATLRTRR